MYNITGSIRRALISAKADDRSEFLQFLLLAAVIIPPKIPGSGQSGSAPKSNGLLLVRHPTPSTPNTFIKIRRYLLEISENSYKSPSRDGKNSILDPHSVPDASPQCHLPTQLEDVPVSTILGTLSALEALCDYALYKSTFTLHLHYITHTQRERERESKQVSTSSIRYVFIVYLSIVML